LKEHLKRVNKNGKIRIKKIKKTPWRREEASSRSTAQ
jgi:hypothetical protein